MNILGISAFYHDSAAAAVQDGEPVAAAQEERFSRTKHDNRFPSRAVEYCLSEAGWRLRDLDYVVFYDKPLLKFDRLIETSLAFAPKGLTTLRRLLPAWLRERLSLGRIVRDELARYGNGFEWDRLLFAEHHVSHAASAFYASPFDRAAVLTMDGVGEWATTTAALGRGNDLRIVREIHFPHSLGLLYSAMTYYTGFRVNSAEYKVMGLAPYGEPKYASLIRDRLIHIKPDGSFRLNMEYFDFCSGSTMTNDSFARLFGGPPRKPDEPIAQRHMDLAASVQSVLEDAVLRLTRALAADTGEENLCLAGGVALNCVANGKVLRDGKFRKIWIQPAAGDAGGALGAALGAYYQFAGHPRATLDGRDSMKGALLGPRFEQEEIEKRLRAAGAVYELLTETALLDRSVEALVSEKALGWFQGRMEFGPRALGARSILADPRSPRMQSLLNLKVKYRESFRPFAPSVLSERAAEWFDLQQDSPYMLLVGGVREDRRKPTPPGSGDLFGIARLHAVRSEIPAVTHVDYSARVQTVHRETNPLYHALLSAFERSTGCPVLVNTSFNVRGEPIVCTPEDAFLCFMGTDIEALAIGRCFLRKSDQDPALKRSYERKFDPD